MPLRIPSRFLIVFLALTVTTGSIPTFGAGPENLLLVVNGKSKASLEVANHYCSLREIPDRNVFLLFNVPEKESVPVAEFQSKILKPIFAEIRKRNLERQIDYIIYSSDFPTAIRLPKDANKTILPKENQKYFKTVASINSATYFSQLVLNDEFSFTGPTSNFYFRKRAEDVVRINPFTGENKNDFDEMRQAFAKKEYKSALSTAENIIEQDGPRPLTRFWSARCLAKLGRAEEAIKMLNQAVNEGWNFSKWTSNLKDFEKLKTNEKFVRAVERMTELHRAPVRSFSSRLNWRPDGFTMTKPTEGRKYCLSMVLGVSRGKGNSVSEIVSALKTSVAADHTHPEGTFYFVSNKEIRSKTRALLIPEAIEALKTLGMQTETIEPRLPASKPDVLGLVMGVAKFNWSKSRSKILPGAICENLTSFGGVMSGKPGTGQTTVSELIKHGAAGSSGTVVEPYTIPHKFPHPMIHYYYARGCNLAESFYQSVHGPYQLLIVGDPLCRPFGKPVNFKVNGLGASESISGKLKISVEPSELSSKEVRIDSFDLYYDDVLVRSAKAGGTIPFDSTKAKDGYHEFRVVAKTAGPIVFDQSQKFGVYIQNRARLPRLSSKAKIVKLNESLKVDLTSPMNAKLVAKRFTEPLESSLIYEQRGNTSGPVKGISIPASQLGAGPSQIKIFARKNSTELCLGSVTVNVRGEQE